MSERYFVSMPIDGPRATLTGPEAHHLTHVMRARPGTRVTLFDGSGAEFPAAVTAVGRSEVELDVLGRQEVDRELPFGLTLAVALPKGDRQKWLVEKAVELGVTALLPLKTARSVAQPVEQALERLRRTVIEATKQCGRTRLMDIVEPMAWLDFLDAAPARAAACRLLAHPSTAESRPPAPRKTDADAGEHEAAATQTAAGAEHLQAGQHAAAAIGPEGGFTADEIHVARTAGWQTVDLGPRTLRVETAAIYLAALIVTGRQPLAGPTAEAPPAKRLHY